MSLKPLWAYRSLASWKYEYTHTHVLYMFTKSTLAHGQYTSTFTSHCLVAAKHFLLGNNMLAITKQLNTEYVMFLVCANLLLVNV